MKRKALIKAIKAFGIIIGVILVFILAVAIAGALFIGPVWLMEKCGVIEKYGEDVAVYIYLAVMAGYMIIGVIYVLYKNNLEE